MKPLVKIRSAETKDLVTIVKMLSMDELGQLRENLQIPLPQKYLNAFANIIQDSNQELVVMEDESGLVIGTLQLSFIQYLTYQGGIRAQIEAVRIHYDHRGSGIGQQLLKWAIQRAQEKGAHLVQLTTDKKRSQALRFYEKLGFKASHEGMKLHF